VESSKQVIAGHPLVIDTVAFVALLVFVELDDELVELDELEDFLIAASVMLIMIIAKKRKIVIDENSFIFN
jgi:hypothetical protein